MTIGCDYVAGSLPKVVLADLLGELQSVLGVPEEKKFGAHKFQCSATFASGGLVAWSPDREESYIQLSGGSVSLFDSHLGLLKLLARHGLKFTRTDLRLDDHSRELIDLDKVQEAAEAGNVQHFRRMDPRAPVANVVTGELEGRGYNFGRRGNDGAGRYVRFYDKRLESKGEVDCVRLEVELSGDYCREIVKMLLMAEDEAEFGRMAASVVVGSIDFRDRSAPAAHGHLDRMPRLAWWERVVQAAGGAAVRLRVGRVKVGLRECMEYVGRAFPRRFAQVAEVVERSGHDVEGLVLAWFRELVRRGKGKLAGWIPAPCELEQDPVGLLGLAGGGA